MKHEDALDFLEKVRQAFSDRPFVYNSFLDVMKEFKEHSIDTQGVIARVKVLFRGRQDLVLGFNQFLPQSHRIKADGEGGPVKTEAERNKQFAQAYKYVAKVKKRFLTRPHMYKEFLSILRKYQDVHHSVKTVKGQVQRLFRANKDLLDEFSDFLPQGTPFTPGTKKKRAKVGEEKVQSPGKERVKGPRSKDTALFERIKKRLSTQKDAYGDFLKCIHLYTQDVLTTDELVSVLQDVLGAHQELFQDFKAFLGVRLDVVSSKSGYQPCVADLDLSKCPQSGTSYKQLPPEYPLPKCSNRSALCEETLNDRWVSVPTGSEDYSFKQFRKNQYEESLFKCEDDRYELDMVIEGNSSALRVLEPLVEKIKAMSFAERTKYKLPKPLR